MSKLFRIYNGEKNNKADKAFLGGASGIRDYDNIRYPIFLDFNRALFLEYWSEDEIKLGKDISDYNSLTKGEQYAYKMQIGALNWLDSIATDFNYLLGYVVSDPAIRSVLALINSFEVLHNRSYQYLTSTVLNQQEKEESFNEVQKIPEMVERNMHIIKPIQDAADVVTKYMANEHLAEEDKVTDLELMQAIFTGIVHYQMLEGVYFSGGFAYFHSLARTDRMLGSNDMITLIKEDENQHNVIYGVIVQIILDEYPELNTEENKQIVIDAYTEAVELEKKWARHVFADVDTIGLSEYDNYVEYLANTIARNSGMEDLYPDNTVLKSTWINTYGSKHKPVNEDALATRESFLEQNSITYQHGGEDDFDL